jgi:transcriptional regulator with XRE-family HTH domain
MEGGENKMSIGEYIREKRLDVGLMQKELAAKCNVTPQTINFIENSKTKPSIVTLRKIAEVLGVNYFELRQVMKGGDTK